MAADAPRRTTGRGVRRAGAQTACGAHATVRFRVIVETASGLYCEAGGFHIDPWLPVERALITHAHSDHARPGAAAYLCAAPGKSVLQRRLPDARIETLPYGEQRVVGATRVSFHPAGHILGSAQIRVE